MIFYINGIEEKMDGMTGWGQKCVGLFDNNEWAGEGNFCGWYAGEYYLNTTLLAYGIQNANPKDLVNYKRPFDGGFYENINRHYDKISIRSIYCEERIEAPSAAEAIQIFKNQTWFDRAEEYAKQKKREEENKTAKASSVVPPDIQNIMRKARYEKGRGIYLKTITIENISTEEYERLKDWCNELTGKILISVYERPTKDSPKATVTIHNPAMEYLKYFMGDRKT